METFKVQSSPLNCSLSSEKVLNPLKCVICGEVPFLEKLKLHFDIGTLTVKASIELSGKEREKYPRNILMIIIV